MMVLPWFVMAVAVGVPLGLWLRGRAVARHFGQPLFAERWWAFRRLGTFVVTVASTLLLVASGSLSLAASGYIVLITGSLLAWYVLRRQVFGETWSFWGFLRFRAGALVAIGGFWLVVLLSPLFVPLLGGAKWPIALALAAALLLWSRFYPAVTSWALRAKRIDDPLMQSDLQRLVAKMPIVAPTLYRADCGGGVFANALAIPSRRDPRVLFFSTMFERFSHAEVVGVLAHELAHFEQFDARVLRRHAVVSTSLIIMGTLGAAVLSDWMELGLQAAVLWLFAGFGALTLLMRGHQKRETQSDARAVELTGDPESMISALTKLHRLAHLPSQWDESSETTVSHPALARRIAAIRWSTQTTPALQAPIAVPARASGSFLIFDRERLRYVTGVPPNVEHDVTTLVQHADRLQSFAYDKLTRLTVEPKATGAHLALRETSGASTRIPIADDVVLELNALVDGIPIAGPEARVRFADPGRLRLLVSAGALIALATNSIFIVIIQWLLALAHPTAGSAAAAGAALMVAALFLASTPGTQVWMIAALGIGGGALWWAYRRANHTLEDTRAVQLGSAILSVWTLVLFLIIMLAGSEPIRVAETVAGIPAAVAAPASLGALVMAARRRTRWAPIACLLLIVIAAAMALLGTTWFVDGFSRDPLLSTRRGVSAGEFTRGSANLTPLGSVQLSEAYDEVRVSRGGVAFAALDWCDEDTSYNRCDARDVVVGNTSGWTRQLRAADVHFNGDETLVVLDTRAESASLGAESLDGSKKSWQISLPSLSGASLQVDADSGAWVVVAYSDGQMSRFEGQIGSPSVSSRAWPTDDEAMRWTEWATADTDERVGSRVTFLSRTRSMLQRGSWYSLLPSSLTRPDVELVRRDDSTDESIATSALDVTCFDSEPQRSDVPCMAGESHRTHFWRIVPATGEIAPSGWMPGRVHAGLRSSTGPIFAALTDDKWRLIDVNSRRHLPLDFPDDVYQVAVSAEGIAATRWTRDGKSDVSLYRLDAR